MKFCPSHWDRLKQAIKSRGLFDLVAGSGEEAAERVAGELKGAPTTISNFDPLMGAHNRIVHNTMEYLSKVGINPLTLFSHAPEHPELECPICYLNWLSVEHDRTCTNPNCPRPRGLSFDDWIDKAADGAARFAASLQEGGVQ